MKIAVFASGTGSNFINIVNYINKNKLKARVVLLISNNPNTNAVEFAEKNKINVQIINKNIFKKETFVNNEYKFLVSNPILLQYTKEMSIFASS